MLPKHVLDAIHEVADAAVNPTGYADDADDSDKRAAQRDELETILVQTVTSYLG